MNIGIVIGVSDYQKANSLPGCVADANAIKQLFELSNKCDDILFISENTDSRNVKSKIASFVKKYENEDIDEAIFYFSGHGLFDDNEFYYALSDYSESKTKQTSLENSELDNLLRSLSAKLTVKIVDACQAGTRYVKDPDVFRKYLQRTEEGFDKCYFFYSSQNDQSSYQSDVISDFTLSFLKAFIARPNQDVRYKDVMDTLADEFLPNTKQTPFFVMQGNYTEVFGYIAQDVSDALGKIITGSEENEVKTTEDSHKSLIRLVEEEAELYSSREEALSSIERVSESINGSSFSDDINKLYNIKIQTEIDANIPIKTEHVGKSLKNSTHNYLVDIESEQRVRKVPKHGGLLSSFLATSALINSEEVPMVDEYYMEPVGANSIVELPYKFISIRLESKFPNINDTGCILLPFVSQTKIIVFSAFYHYRTREWDVKTINAPSVKWISFEEYIKKSDDISGACDTLLEEFEIFSLSPIKKRFELLDVDTEEDS